jgi:hypothetical protein
MKTLKSLFLLVLIASFTSCQEPDEGGQLDIQVGPQNANIIPVAQKSCEDLLDPTASGSLGKASAILSVFRFTWKGANQLVINYALLKIESGFLSGKYAKFITDDELSIALGGSTTIAGGDSTIRTSTCGLRFGGITFTQPASPAFLTGTVTIFGTEVDADGNTAPVKAEAQVSLQYAGDPSVK